MAHIVAMELLEHLIYFAMVVQLDFTVPLELIIQFRALQELSVKRLVKMSSVTVCLPPPVSTVTNKLQSQKDCAVQGTFALLDHLHHIKFLAL